MNKTIAPTTDQLDSLLGEVVEQYLQQLARGQQPDIERYAKDHPEIAALIRQTFPALKVCNQPLTEINGEQMPDLSTAKQLGDFRLLHQLGSGGMGVVYEAEQLSMGRRVALKILPMVGALQQKQLLRFRNEVRAVAMLDHPHIVSVYSVGEERGVHFYAMQLIRGQSLAEVIQDLQRGRAGGGLLTGESIHQVLSLSISRSADARVSASADQPTEEYSSKLGATPNDKRATAGTVAEFSSEPAPDTRSAVKGQISTAPNASHDHGFFRSAAKLGIQAAEALQHAHDQGVLHRDIKPGNLMLDAEAQLHITDFGLARIDADGGVTMTGDILGTLRYMSPEQALAKRVVVDQRSDIYSLGVTLYELLTLQPAFSGNNRQSLLHQIAFEEPKLPTRINRAIPRELETIVMKAIAKNPRERYATAQELADDLERYLDDMPIQAKRPSLLQRTSKWSHRNSTFVRTAVATVAIALLIGGALLWQQRSETLAALEQAKQNAAQAEAHLVMANDATKRETRQRELAQENAREAEAQQRLAEENFRQARQAVDRYYTLVSEGTLHDVPGMEVLRKQLLEAAVQYYEQFVDQRAKDPDVQAELAAAHYRVTQFYAELNSPKWFDHAEQAFKILGPLVDAGADTTNWESLRAGLFTYRGEPVGSDRSIEDMLHAYQEGIRIWEKLVEENAGVRGFQNDLAGVHWVTGALQLESNRKSEGERSVQTAMEIWRRLASEYPEEPNYRWQLARSYNSMAAVHAQSASAEAEAGRHQKSAEALRQAVELLDQLVTDFPGVPKYREQLASFYNALADSLRKSNQEQESLEVRGKAVKMLKELAAEFPGVPEYWNQLAKIHSVQAVELGETRVAETEEAYVQELAAREQQVSDFPEMTEYAHGLTALSGLVASVAKPHLYRGDAWFHKGDYRQAIAEYTEAIQFHPTKARALYGRGLTYFRLREFDKAFADCAAAIRLEPHNTLARPERLRLYGGRCDMRHVNSAEVVFASDMPWIRGTCLGAPLRDMNGHGQYITIAGTRYPKGVWMQAFRDGRPADVVIDVSGHKFVQFEADVGLTTVNGGSVQFQVIVDGEMKAQSPILRSRERHEFRVDMTDAREVVLRVLDGGDAHPSDDAAWGSACFVNAGDHEPLEPSLEIRAGEPADWLFLTMLHWKLEEKQKARGWYQKAVAWIDERQPDDEALHRFAALRDINDEAWLGLDSDEFLAVCQQAVVPIANLYQDDPVNEGSHDDLAYACAQENLGLTLEQLGHQQEAEEAYRATVDAAEKLVAHHEESDDYRFVLNNFRRRLFRLLIEQDKLQEAQQLLRKSVSTTEEILAQLKSDDLSSQYVRNAVADDYRFYGDALAKAEDPEAATQAFEKAILLREQLSIDFPTETNRLLLCRLYEYYAGHLEKADDSEGARQAWEKTLACADQLAIDFSKENNRYAHVGTWSRYAKALEQTDDLEGTKQAWEKTIKLSEQLANDFPNKLNESQEREYRVNQPLKLVVHLGRMSNLLLTAPDSNQRDPARASELVQTAIAELAALEKLAADNPDYFGSKWEVLNQIAVGYHNLSFGLDDSQFEDKEFLYRKSIQIEEECAKGDPSEDLYRRNLATMYTVVLRFLVNHPDPQDRHRARANAMAKKAIEQLPEQGELWRSLGMMHYRNADWEAAIQTLDKSIELGFKSCSNQFFLAMTHWQLGHRDEARRWYDQAVEHRWKHFPDDDDVRGYHTEAASVLGIPLEENGQDEQQNQNDNGD